MLLRVVVAVFCALATAVSVEIPSYLVPCSKSKPECLTESAQMTLKGILKGDRKLKIPSITPVHLPSVEIVGGNLNLTLKNLEVYGLEEATATSVKINTDKQTIEATLFAPKLVFVSDYTLTGKILVLELNGSGKENITGYDLNIIWNLDYELVEKNGEKYAKIVKDDIKFTASRFVFQFDDLFKGQEQLTISTNEVLNNEWEIVIDDLGGGISRAFGALAKTITSQFFENIPFDELYTS